MSAVAPCSGYKVCSGRTVLQHTAAVPGARALGYTEVLLAQKGCIWGFHHRFFCHCFFCIDSLNMDKVS